MASADGCPKHANLPQLPGVCSSCLRERLHQLVDSPMTFAAYPNELIESHSFSGPSNNVGNVVIHPWSPGVGRCGKREGSLGRHQQRHGSSNSTYASASEVAVALLLGVRCGAGSGVMKKSRSMTAVPGGWNGMQDGEEEEEDVEEDGVVKMKVGKRGGKGFWSKLIRFKSMRRDHRPPATQIILMQ